MFRLAGVALVWTSRPVFSFARLKLDLFCVFSLRGSLEGSAGSDGLMWAGSAASCEGCWNQFWEWNIIPR